MKKTSLEPKPAARLTDAFQLRLDAARRRAWQEAADRRSQPLATYVKAVVDADAGFVRSQP